MSGFKEGSVQLRKKDVGNSADPNHLKILVDTNNNLYTIDEYGVYRPVGGGYDIQVSGTSLTLVTSASTKIISLNDTGVVSGTYGSQTVIPAFKVGADGRIISVSSMPISATGLGTVTSIGVVSNTLGISSSPVTTSGSIIVNLSAIGTSGIFTKFVKDIYGRVTSGGYIGVIDILDRSTDGTLSANSDNKIPTEKAIKTYVDENDKRNSVGIIDSVCNDIIDNGDGTATILPQNVYIFDNSTFQGNLYKFYVAGTTLSFLDGIEQHVCVKYNGGTPIFYVENNMSSINESDVFCTHIVWRQGLTLHSMGRDSKGVGLSNKIARSLLMTHPYSKSIDGGLVLSETSTPTPRTVLITSATVYAGIVPISVLSFNSSIDKLTFAYHSGGIWNYTSASTYQNSQYDDGVNLVSATNNKYIVNWFYRSIGDIKETFYVPGVNQYNKITEAEQEAPRGDLSLILRRHCVLVAKVIVLQGASTGLVENVSDVNFTNSTIPNHNDLNNIQGGSLNNYYHVSASTFGYLSGVSADIQNQLNNVLTKDILEVTKEPTGFPRIDNTKLLFNNSTRYFTLSALSGNYDVYFRGNKIIKTTDTIQIPNLSGLHFIYFTSAGVLTTSQTPWDIFSTIQISILYWTGVSALDLCEERHGCVMDCATHDYLHKTFKTQYVDGFDASYTKNNATAITFGLTDGIISDEDLSLTASNGIIGNYFTQPLNNSAYLPVYYRSGVDGNGTWRKDTATVYPYKNSAPNSYANFNELVTGNWVQTPATNNYYVAYFIYATNNTLEPVISVQGQRQDSDSVDALNLNTPTSLLTGDFPFVEAKLLYRIIVGVKSSYSNNFKSTIEDVTDYRTLGVTIGGNTGGTGTVTYVGLSANPILNISGSPITNAGNFIINFSPEISGTFLRGPISGNSSIPTFGPILSSDLPMLSAYTLNTTTSAISASLLTKINSISANYTTRTEVSGVSANLQSQITNNNNSLSAYYRTSGGPIFGNISASGNISGNSFVKIGGTSAQFLKANGSIDSNVYITSSALVPYILTTTVSAISGNLQNQINNDKNSLSAYLPLSGGNVYGRLYLGNSSNNGYLDLKTNGTSAGQTDINYRGGTSANRRMTIRYDEIKDCIEIFSSNDDGSARSNIQRMYRNNTTPSRYYTGLDVATGDLSVQSLSASKLVSTNASKELISYTLTSADIPSLPQYALNTTVSAISGSLQSQITSISSNYTTRTEVSGVSANLQSQITNNNLKLSAYLPLSGGTLTGQLKGTTISASGNISAVNFVGNLTGYKNVEAGNETTIANGFSSNQALFINYRGATSSINQYIFWNGLAGAGTYSGILASAFKKNGGTSAQFLKADGSSDSNIYTTTTTTSAISANLQNQITNNNNSLSAYLPIKNNTKILMSNFFGSSVYLYDQLSGTGVGFTDTRSGNWRGGFVSNNSACGYHQDATYSSAFKPFTISDGAGNVWFTHDPLSTVKHKFNGTMQVTGNISGDSGALIGLNAQEVLRIYRPTSGVTTTFGQTFEAQNNVGQRVIYSRIRTSIDGAVSGLHSGSFLFSVYKNGIETTAITISDTQLKVFGTVSASGQMYSPQFNGNLNGYKNVDNSNECTISNGYIDNSGLLYINYRGAISAINEYRFCKGQTAVTYADIRTNSFIKNGGTSTQFLKADGSVDTNSFGNYLPLSGGTMTGNILFYNPGNGNSRGLSGDIGSSESWTLLGKSSTTGAGDLSINLYTSGFSMVPLYIIQWSGGTPQNLVTLVDANGKSGFNDIGCRKITNNVYGDIGYVQGSTTISDTGIFSSMLSADNMYVTGFTGSKVLVSNTSKQIVETTTTTTEVNYLVGVSANVQTQINALQQQSLSGFGAGTLNRITKFITTSSVGNSNISDDGSTVFVYSTLSATGNVTAPNFVGNLDGRINTQFGNETIIANGFNSAPGDLLINYRGASAQIKTYKFLNGFGEIYSGVMASGFKTPTGTNAQFLMADGSISLGNNLAGYYLPLSGGTLTRNLKISAYSEGWSEGLRVMVPSGSWGGFRLTRSSSLAGTEDNWSIGYRADSTGDLLFGNYTSGSDKEHTIFYKNGDVYHSGNITATSLSANSINLNTVTITKTTPNTIKLQGTTNPDRVNLNFGTGASIFGYNGTYNLFYISGDFEPTNDNVYSLGSSSFRWRNIHANNFYENGSLLSSRYLPLSGGTMTGNINFADPGLGNTIGIRGYMANNDIWGIRGRADLDDLGYLEIYTEDNGNEPIFVSQYLLGDLHHRITLLDESGNTQLTNTYSNSFVKNGGTNLQFLMADGSISLGDNLAGYYLPLSGGNITNHITYTTATDSGNVFPSGYTYYETSTTDTIELPTPIKSKEIYIFNSNTGLGNTYLKPPTGVTIYYYGFNGATKTCNSSQHIILDPHRTLKLVGNNSTEYSIIGPHFDAT